ncbi:uncharacterized protein E0L32_011639 [Thyridium curvatum]|uniref:Tubulin-specific chaperone A n=1 Tax=Thyridium curvatum TaxID=1093900 RepID=A0A507BI71_9PEZI|nr:uncharacterized protein E0L32_011639 [Thyridium curvatum]TPX18454.1 hypothetical protein E0L32_011639 [Thyridium curvatum]
MPAPSELAIATKAVERLTKEERYYQSELVRQQERVQKLEEEIKKGGADLDPNAEFILRQEKQAADETVAIFTPLKERTEAAVTKLEEQLAMSESSGSAADDELTAAREALKKGQQAVQKDKEES